MHSADTVTHRDLAQALGVSETTIKSYRAKFPGFLPVAREGKPVRLHPEALEVCRAIRDHFAAGLTVLMTAEALRGRFKEYPHARSAAPERRAVPRDESQVQELAQRIRELTEAQARAQERMEQLEAEVRNLATLEASSKALVLDFFAELRAAKNEAAAATQDEAAAGAWSAPAPEPEFAPIPEEVLDGGAHAPEAPGGPAQPTVLRARRIVTVRGSAGAASYELGEEPAPASPFADLPRPDRAFLDLPVVIRTERGEFLGLPGRLSVERLVAELEQAAPGPRLAAWFEEDATPGGSAWTCSLGQTRAEGRELSFERTTTPRGNTVAHLRRLVTSGIEAGPGDMQDFLRGLRDGLLG